MKFDELFEQRNIVAVKLKECLRDRGFTKVSFAKKTDISRPTLDKILSGNIDSKTTFDRHMQKIMKSLDMSIEDLMFYSSKKERHAMTVYSQNMPENHEMSEKAKKQYDLMLDVVDLCSIYY